MRVQPCTRRLRAACLAALTIALVAAGGSLASAQTTSQQVSTDSLIYDLKNPDAPRRLAAARELGTARYLPAIPALLPLAEDPDLSKPESALLREVLKHRWAGRLGLATIG